MKSIFNGKVWWESSCWLLLFPTIMLPIVKGQGALNDNTQGGGFNFEIEKRVYERVSELMNVPVRMLGMGAKFTSTKAFQQPFLQPYERDQYFQFMYALSLEFNQDVFYGQEDGLFMGYVKGSGTYLEGAGSGGYELNMNGKPPAEYEKWFDKCINRENGEHENCAIEEGGEFIECIDGCSLEVCPGPNADLYANCTNQESPEECAEEVTWCPKYKRKTVDNNKTIYGYIPRYWYCVDDTGSFTENEGAVFSPSQMETGTCTYEDGTRVSGKTPIPRAFGYCGANGETCDDIFVGGYQSRRYDHRMRAWYEEAKIVQKSCWSKPYPFATNLDIGVTYIKPVHYIDEQGRKVFRGAFTVNYELEDITVFLQSAFFNTTASVLIVEDAEPNYIIGSSTGSGAARKVKVDDPTQPCLDILADECTVVRATPENFAESNNTMDVLLARALAKQAKAGFPKELVVFKAAEDIESDPYVSQSLIYEQPGENLRWRIIVAMPAGKATSDLILPGDSMFGVVIVVSMMGFGGCISLFWLYFSNRSNQEVAISDWRFTSAFILGCALLNLSSLTLLGPATNATCMVRMWSFHFLYVLVLTPLLVKVWRMYKLVGKAQSFRRKSINNLQAGYYTLPAIVAQIVILTLFSIWDPPARYEYIDVEGGSSCQHIVCSHESIVFAIVQLVFEGGLALVGCFLAFQTRNLGSRMGEAKPLIFAMYNVALVGLIVVLMRFLMDSSQAANYVVVTIGVFWATIFSSCVFVLPRLLRAKRRNSLSLVSINPNGTSTRTHISGLDFVTENPSSTNSHPSSICVRRLTNEVNTRDTMNSFNLRSLCNEANTRDTMNSFNLRGLSNEINAHELMNNTNSNRKASTVSFNSFNLRSLSNEINAHELTNNTNSNRKASTVSFNIPEENTPSDEAEGEEGVSPPAKVGDDENRLEENQSVPVTELCRTHTC